MKVFKNQRLAQRILDTYDKLLERWEVDKEEREIMTTFGSTHVILCGTESSPPLVLFHGVGDNSALMWLYNAKPLAQHFRIVAIDTMGGPGKSRPNENYNKNFDVIQWIDEVLDQLLLDQIYVAGVSNGAYLAQKYGLHRPDRVMKILCMAGSIPVGNFGSMKMMMSIFLPEALFPTRHNATRLLRKLTGINIHVFTDHPLVLDHYLCLLKGFNNMAMRYHKITHFNDEQIKAISGKTLFLVGEDDPFAQRGGKQALLQYNMNAQFFPQVGHGINHEIAEEVNQLIISYLLSSD